MFLIFGFSTKHYITNVLSNNNGYIGHIIYKECCTRVSHNTNHIIKHVNNQINDVTINYKTNTINNVRNNL